MSVLFVLVPVALTIVLVAVAGFVWCSRSGQFDDLSTPALRPLIDDRPTHRPAHPPASEPGPGGVDGQGNVG